MTEVYSSVDAWYSVEACQTGLFQYEELKGLNTRITFSREKFGWHIICQIKPIKYGKWFVV